jgi:hypothetical protein
MSINMSNQRLLLRKVSSFWQRGSSSSSSKIPSRTTSSFSTGTSSPRLPSNANPIQVAETKLLPIAVIDVGGEGMEFHKVAEKLGIRLTAPELDVLRKKLDYDGDGLLS